MRGTPRDRYSTVAIILHWVIAALVIANVLIGWQASDLKGPERRELMSLHLPIGVCILGLTVVLIAWRVFNRPPPLPAGMPGWERVLAKTVHFGFYAVLLAMPLSGWLTVSAHEGARPVDMFGLFQFPLFAPVAAMEHEAQHALHDATEAAHHLIAKAIAYVLVPLHVAGALKHQFLDGEDEFGRILPFATRRRKA